MAGIYLHIPFCKQACNYCNFHFSTNLKQKSALVDAILLELEHQQDYLGGVELSSIYFGGGTPSLLTHQELAAIFEKIYALHAVRHDAEITLEANPDDLTLDKIAQLRDTPVNRLSIGIQSFFDEDLRWMNRAHQADHAHACIDAAQMAGFENITADLIYGVPVSTDERWRQNLQIIAQKGIPHLSCYALTIEEKTALAHAIKKKNAPPTDDEQALRQFAILLEETAAMGMIHYEISNFAKPGHFAKHNSSYWLGDPYLGVGPAAHSFNGKDERSWNIANNAIYIKQIAQGVLPSEKETLTTPMRYNEYVMTSLRTIYGCEEEKLMSFGEAYHRHFVEQVREFLDVGDVLLSRGKYVLQNNGKTIADHIASQLFWI